MLEILMWVAGLLLVAVALILIVASTKPDRFRVERGIAIKAPPEKIFALLNDFHAWSTWSPWEKKDPGMTRTHSGPPNGVGAAYAWDGNKNVGQGRMEILESVPPSRLVIKLDFLKPFEAHNTAEFTLTSKGDSTEVLWVMHGPQIFIGKLMDTVMSMDRMIGKDFEQGLANIKAAAER